MLHLSNKGKERKEILNNNLATLPSYDNSTIYLASVNDNATVL